MSRLRHMFVTLLEEQIQKRSVVWTIVGIFAFYGVGYVPSNHNPLLSPRELHLFAFEEAIPTVGWTVLVYMSLVVMIILTIDRVAVYGSKIILAKAMTSIVAALGALFSNFLLVPTTYPRPQTAPDGWAEYLLGFTQQVDAATNCFPSTHCMVATYLGLVICSIRAPQGVKILWLLWSTAICLSTLTTKQHYVVDVIAGVCAGTACFVLFYYRADLKENPTSAT